MAEIDRLIDIMARLRDPDGGCPWDLEQDFASIAPYTIEEAYEVADAIARGDREDLRDELGDLLLQVVYHAQLAGEEGAFAFDDVARAIAEKLVRRHPHVFGDAGERPVEAVRRTWEDTKAREREERRARRGEREPDGSADPFADVPLALPALRRAAKLLGRAERAGLASATEAPQEAAAAALGELAGEIDSHSAPEGDRAPNRRRVGELLLAVVALARRLGVDPERALDEQTRAWVEQVSRRP